MADTKRLLSALQVLLANNTTKAVSAQDLRDFLVSVKGSEECTTVTATPTTLDNDDEVIAADASGGAITLNLPAVATSKNKTYTVVRTSASNNVVLDGNASETINGATTYTLSSQWQFVKIICDGTQWIVIAS
jgi:hypothetical protein